MIGDVISKAIVHFEADTDDLKKGIKDLQGEERKLAEQQLAQANARNKQLDDWKTKLATVTAAAGAVAVAGKLLWEGWEHQARKAQLVTNAAGLDVERLRKGFGGLRTEMQALESASALANSKFKLTGDQMEVVGKAMRQLVREGHDWEEVNKKVTESFVKLNGGGLDDFGIHVKEAKTESEKFNAILDAMTEKSGKLNDRTKSSAERMAEMKVKFTDAMDGIKLALGEVAVALVPIVEKIAQLTGLAAKLGSMIPGGFDTIVRFIPGIGQAKNALDAFDYLTRGDGTLNALNIPQGRRLVAAGSGPMPDEEIGMAPLYVGNAGRQRGGGSWRPTMPGYGLGSTSYGQGGDMFGASGYGGDSGITSDMLSGRADRVQTARWQAELEAHRGYNAFQSSKLEGIFGPLQEFDAYRTAFETLNGAIGTAFGAWIDGSQSAGEAFKKFIGEALKGVAVQMAMEALKHGAYAIGNLAFGNFAGAAQHGKAAAAFAAGAVLVGGAAKALHSGGAGAGAGGAAPGGGVPAYSGGGSSQQQGSNVTIVYGQDFTNQSARQRQLHAERIVNEAKGGTGVTYA